MSRDLVMMFMVVAIILVGYFLSFQLQRMIAFITNKFHSRLGNFATRKEYALQRYVYHHRGSIVAKFYNWVNAQIISLGLKNLGVTPIGYLIFWAFISFLLAVGVSVLTKSNLISVSFYWFVIYFCLLIMTRVIVSGRMEKRESDVMDAIDLIIPEIHTGVKNSILRYQDNFPESIRPEFKSFISNIQDRGYTFNEAMMLLADSLGLIFFDFSQKAIFYEAIGEKDMIDIFSDIVETNRIRRELRDKNNIIFSNLKVSFVISTVMTIGYFFFIITTDSFSRKFFLQSEFGKVLLVIMMLVVFGVLSFITTIKSKAI